MFQNVQPNRSGLFAFDRSTIACGNQKTAWLVFDIPKTPTAQKHIDSRKQHQLGLKGYVHVIKVMN